MAMINDPDSLTWGRLVKSWATGFDYINTPAAQQPPHAPPPAPAPGWTLPKLNAVQFDVQTGAGTVQRTIPGVLYQTTDDFKALLGKAGIKAVNFPQGTSAVIVVQGDENTMVLRLPPTTVLRHSEQNLLAGGAYPTPTFYEALFTPEGDAVVHANPPTLPHVDRIMDLHANRIGDYTMGLCA